MSLFRCTNDACERPDREFDAEDGLCADCGQPAQELVPIHYVRPHPTREGRLEDAPACGIANTRVGLPHTTDRAAVTCLRCKEVANG